MPNETKTAATTTAKASKIHDPMLTLQRAVAYIVLFVLCFICLFFFYVLIVSLINAFQLFPQIMIMTDGGPNGATQVMVERIYKYGFRYYRMGYAAAFSWILFAIIMVCTAIQMKGQERWVNYDS